MEMLGREVEKIDEDDPRQAAAMMRKLSEATGLALKPEMKEALERMERGEDPEKIEEEMGALLDSDDPFSLEEISRKKSSQSTPRIDETLYDL